MSVNNIKDSNCHQLTVTFYKNGQEVFKKIPLSDVEIDVGEKKCKVADLINSFVNEIAALKDENANLKKYIEEMQKNDGEWKNKTNDVISAIAAKLDELESV